MSVAGASCRPTTAPDSGSATLQPPVDHVKAAADVAYSGILEQMRQVTIRSPLPAVEEALTRAKSVQEQLARSAGETSERASQLEVVTMEVARLQAAADVRKLRRQMEMEIEADAKKAHRKVRDMDAYRKVLREKNISFRKLDDALVSAERTYADCSSKVAEKLRGAPQTL